MSLTVRDLPEYAMEVLKSRANRNHRSLNGEILYILDYVSAFGPEYDFPARPAAVSQQEKVLGLFGKWKDSRSDAEISADIEGARSLGREVSL